MIGAEALCTMLDEYETTHFFYVPVLSPPMIKEMLARGIQPVVPHGEMAAVYMADGYARVGGRVGVCGSQTIGSSNLAAGLREAWVGRSPVLALTGGPDSDTRGRNFYQDLDDRDVFRPVTKHQAVVDRGDRLPDVIRQAFRMATTGAPRPVHIGLAGFWGAVTLEDVPGDVSVDVRFGAVPALRSSVDPLLLERATAVLNASARPIVLVGGGARRSDAAPALRDLLDRTGLPAVTTLNGMGLLPDTHPSYLGTAGDYGRDSANQALAESDCVLVVGSSLGSMSTKNWQLISPSATVLQIDVDEVEIGRNYPATVPLLGDAALVLEQLAGRPLKKVDTKWRLRVHELRGEWENHTPRLEHSLDEPLRPEALLYRLSQALPDDAVVVADTGHAGAWCARHLRLGQGHTFVRAAGSLGWGLPAAIGAKCATRDRPVVCFTGDGGLYYHIAELETAARYDLPIVVVVNNNVGMNQERSLWDAGTDQEKNWKFSDVDLVAVAEGFGCAAERVERADALETALARAIASGRPTLLDVRTDPAIACPPSWSPTT
ncbi:thiamine pyrophosphate-binding protein [Streptomyces sp. NPDC050759]|uniref:thiamine pyrophosphate-binding protein n=1 Tax=Streptomyces sp. NPDC050759 TaxID=3365635 RepID=UPI0037926932